MCKMSAGKHKISSGDAGNRLIIRERPANTVAISWPSHSTGWNLEQKTNLGATIWVTPPRDVGDNGTNRFIIVNPPAGNRFFRLIRQ